MSGSILCGSRDTGPSDSPELANIVLRFIHAIVAGRWQDLNVMRHVSPMLVCHIQSTGAILRGLNEFLELVQHTVTNDVYTVEPVSILSELFQDREAERNHMADTNVTEIRRARTWVHFKTTNVEVGISQESVGLFDLKQGNSEVWMIYRYTALRCMPSMPEEYPLTTV